MKPSSVLPLLAAIFPLFVSALPQNPEPTTTIHTTSTFTATKATTAPQFTSQSPAMSSASVSSVFAALATATPLGPDTGPDDTGGNSASSQNAAGASGSDTGSINLSRGGMIAIIVVVAVVAIFGIVSTVLFYLAKKRSWEVKATIRRSAKRVVTALTPRRSEFPKSVKESGRSSSRGMTRMPDVPPTPRLTKEDLEKGAIPRMSEFDVSEPNKKSNRWARKSNR